MFFVSSQFKPCVVGHLFIFDNKIISFYVEGKKKKKKKKVELPFVKVYYSNSLK
jgi:hypothetical protein